MAGYDREDARPRGSVAEYTDSKRDEYSTSAQLEALANELAVLTDMIDQAEVRFSPILLGDDVLADGGEKEGMDRRTNSPIVETLISARAKVRNQTRRLQYIIERAQI